MYRSSRRKSLISQTYSNRALNAGTCPAGEFLKSRLSVTWTEFNRFLGFGFNLETGPNSPFLRKSRFPPILPFNKQLLEMLLFYLAWVFLVDIAGSKSIQRYFFTVGQKDGTTFVKIHSFVVNVWPLNVLIRSPIVCFTLVILKKWENWDQRSTNLKAKRRFHRLRRAQAYACRQCKQSGFF